MSRVVVKFIEGITIPFENGELIGWEAHDRFVCALQMPLLGHQDSPLRAAASIAGSGGGGATGGDRE